jgi:hypothetical protein
MRIGIDMRVDHRVDQRVGPFRTCVEGAGFHEMGALLGNAGLDGVPVAARRSRALAVLAPVGISLVRPATCASFCKIIVSCKIQEPPRGEGGAATKRARHRLRQNAGRGSGRKSKRLHGAHYTPVRRVPDKSGDGEGSV